MPVVQYKQAAPLCQVEGFPLAVNTDKKTDAGDVVTRKFERSDEGALHFRPGGTMVLTADEFGWLKGNKLKVFANLLVLADDPAPAAVPETKAVDTPKLSKKSDDGKIPAPSES